MPEIGGADPNKILRAHMQQAVADIGNALIGIGESMRDLSTGMQQASGVAGPDRGKAGGVAYALRKAAWRIEHGTLDGFSEAEEARQEPRKRALAEAFREGLRAAANAAGDQEQAILSIPNPHSVNA